MEKIKLAPKQVGPPHLYVVDKGVELNKDKLFFLSMGGNYKVVSMPVKPKHLKRYDVYVVVNSGTKESDDTIGWFNKNTAHFNIINENQVK